MASTDIFKSFKDDFRTKYDPFIIGIEYLADRISSGGLWTYNVKEPLVPSANQTNSDIKLAKSSQKEREAGMHFYRGNPFDPSEKELVKLNIAIHILDKLGEIPNPTDFFAKVRLGYMNRDLNHVPRSLHGSPTENFIYILNANKNAPPLVKFLQQYANEMYAGIYKASISLISKYNLPGIAKSYLQLGLSIDFDHELKNKMTRVLNLLNRLNNNSKFPLAETLKIIQLYNFKDYQKHLKNLRLGDFILGINESWKVETLYEEFQNIMPSLSSRFPDSNPEMFLDRVNVGTSDRSFWLLDCNNSFFLFKDIYLEFLPHVDENKIRNSDMMFVLKASILNLCYSALDPKNRRLIKKVIAPTFFQQILMEKDTPRDISYFRKMILNKR